jgi:hypothetical protein
MNISSSIRSPGFSLALPRNLCGLRPQAISLVGQHAAIGARFPREGAQNFAVHPVCPMRSVRSTDSTRASWFEARFAATWPRPNSRVLCPTLRKGDVVIMDNLSPHKSEPTLSFDCAGRGRGPLPAYSSEFNPIEKMWRKIKASLRSAQARTQSALIQAIALALASVIRQK